MKDREDMFLEEDLLPEEDAGLEEQLSSLLDEVISEDLDAADEEAGDEHTLSGEEEEEQQMPAKKGKGLTAAIIVLSALILAICGGGYYYLFHMGGAEQQPSPIQPAPTAALSLEMPDLMYETADVAERALKEYGLCSEIYYVPSADTPAGLVTLQGISPGGMVKAGDTVQIYISMGPAPTPTPIPTPLPTPTPRATEKPRPRPTEIPVFIAPTPEVTPCPP